MRTLLSLTVAVLALGLMLTAQDKGAKGGGKAKAAAPKNLKILNADGYMDLMRVFVPALGLERRDGCNYCHAPDRASDEKPQKVVARQMIAMVRDINAKQFGGEQKVTCYTCHRGNPIPAEN